MNRQAVIAVLLFVILIVGLVIQHRGDSKNGRASDESDHRSAHYSPWVEVTGGDRRSRDANREAADWLPDSVLLPRIRRESGAIRGERALIFSNAEDLQAFVDGAADAGFEILGRLDRFNALRVGGVANDESLEKFLDDLGVEEPEIAGNFSVATPKLPVQEQRDPLDPEPFRNLAVEWLDLAGIDRSQWGEGVRIAVLDGGVAPIFSDRQISNTLVHETAPSPEGGAAMHGTAVSSIIVSTDPRIPGIAPAAELLGFSVMGENGLGDSFSLANGIVAAVDAGVDLINASLGSAGDSPVVREAVQYAEDNGVLIIASAGNEQLTEVAFPARYPETVAVGAIDALGRQLTFSNSGESLAIGAPGQEIYAFGAEGTPVSFSGTSASAPFVTAAIAAVMSQEPNLSARQASDLLIQYADEAAAPGFDSSYGYGNLNLNRVLNRNEPNLRDVAVASHYVTEDVNGQPVVQVVVENRGTAVAPNPRLNVDLGGTRRVALLPPIQPNAIFAQEFPLIPGRITPAEIFDVQSQVTWSGDINDKNNTLSTDISSQLGGGE